jgi:hypothetical protein
VEKLAFSKKRVLFNSKLDLNWGMKLVKSYIWSIDFHGVEIGTLQKIEQE